MGKLTDQPLAELIREISSKVYPALCGSNTSARKRLSILIKASSSMRPQTCERCVCANISNKRGLVAEKDQAKARQQPLGPGSRCGAGQRRNPKAKGHRCPAGNTGQRYPARLPVMDGRKLGIQSRARLADPVRVKVDTGNAAPRSCSKNADQLRVRPISKSSRDDSRGLRKCLRRAISLPGESFIFRVSISR